MFAVYFALCFAYPAGMGFGDVKLSGVLGLYTAWLGWGVWAVGLFLGFLLGGVFGIASSWRRRAAARPPCPSGRSCCSACLSPSWSARSWPRATWT
jgi:leader peptidase (prepilin peptidase)/N-methyltransferase